MQGKSGASGARGDVARAKVGVGGPPGLQFRDQVLVKENSIFGGQSDTASKPRIAKHARISQEMPALLRIRKNVSFLLTGSQKLSDASHSPTSFNFIQSASDRRT